jgi:hypothetical protein
MTINLHALLTKVSGLADDILHQHHDDARPGTHGMDFYELLKAISSLVKLILHFSFLEST